MTTKKYNFVRKEDVFGYLFMFGFIPYLLFKWVIGPSFEPFDPLTSVSYSIFLSLGFICYYYFHPKLAGITEIREGEIRFFNYFGSATRWAPIDHYRYIAKDSDPDHVMVYKRNCKKVGKIPLKSAGPEEKREFLAHIEPWLVLRKEDVSQKIDVEK